MPGAQLAQLEEKVAFPRDLEGYTARGEHPGCPCHVVAIETNYAWIFLAGKRVYKLKKAVRQDSRDHRTLARCERACRAERRRVNRRLAPSIYLWALPFRRKRRGHLSRRPGEGIADWLVAMVRLPHGGMLDLAIKRDAVSEHDLARLIARLADLFGPPGDVR